MERIAKAGFYNSWYTLAGRLDATERLAFYDAIFKFYFEGVEPEEESAVYNYFVMAKPIIEKDITDKANGAKGGHNKGVNTPLNTPLESPLNTKVKVKVKENEKEKVNVKVSDKTATTENNNFLYIKNFLTENNFKASAETKRAILERLEEKNLNADFLDFCLTSINSKYPEATENDLNGLFINSVLSWDNLITSYKAAQRKAEKKGAKEKLNIWLTAPTSCTFCGSKLQSGALPNTLECFKCRDNGRRTFWEFINNEWICSR